MAKRSYFGSAFVPNEEGEVLEINYYRMEESAGPCASYGVLVEVECAGCYESAAVGEITTSLRRIEEILTLLYRNTVTPCTLQEIIWDEIHKF